MTYQYTKNNDDRAEQNTETSRPCYKIQTENPPVMINRQGTEAHSLRQSCQDHPSCGAEQQVSGKRKYGIEGHAFNSWPCEQDQHVKWPRLAGATRHVGGISPRWSPVLFGESTS